MGSLILKRKLFNKVIFKSFESRTIRFKGPIGTTLYNFIDPWPYFNNINSNYIMNVYTNGLNNALITFTSDSIDWYDSNGINLMNDYVIPLDTIFQLESTSNIYALLDLGGNAEEYYQGKTSIKKQNLGSGKILVRKAPSGIPVASTERVNVTLPPVIWFPATSTQLVGYYSTIGVRDYWVDGEYGQESWSVGENINYLNSNFYWSAISRFGAVELIAPNNYSAIANHGELFDGLRSYWRLVYWEMNCSDGYCSRNPAYLFNCVNGTNPNLIPTTNWSPSITITAA